MEISGNSLNQPVNFYTKNTGNTINMAIDSDNRLYPNNNIFAPEFGAITNPKQQTTQKKKKNTSFMSFCTESQFLPGLQK